MAWKPICLKSKEGLALLNGTQFMSAYFSYTFQGLQTIISSRFNKLCFLEAFDGRIEPFNELVQFIRPRSAVKDC